MNEEKICIEFSGEEFDRIMKYAKVIEADTVQAVVMNAINVAIEGVETDW